MLSDSDIYTLLGEQGFADLVRAFYAQVPDDPVLGPMYQRSMDQTGETLAMGEAKLRDFLVQRFGGPGRYSEQRGHPKLRMRHGRFVIDAAAAEHWLALMERAMIDANTPEQAREVLRPYFHTTAHHMVNR